MSIAIDTVFFAAGYVILAAFGFFAVRSGHGYRYTFSRTWIFIGLWFMAGVANFTLGRGETPSNWTPEKDSQAFWGYVLATVLFLPVAFASSGLGVLTARLMGKLRHGSSSAA